MRGGDIFNEDLDELLEITGIYYRTEKVRFIVCLRRFDGGPVRVSIEKQWRSKRRPEWQVKKVGRYLPAEAAAIGPMMAEAAQAAWKYVTKLEPAALERDIDW